MNTPKQEVTVTYQGIVITYDEQKDQWVFEVRGRERKVDSLIAAKAIIDKPDPKDKPPFTRIKAYSDSPYSRKAFPVVEVTSIASGNSAWFSYVEYWTNYEGSRSKIRGSYLFPVGLKNNDKIVKELNELSEQLEVLELAFEAAKKKLTSLESK